MKIEKRSENSYRVRKSYNGRVYTVNFDHKPTQKEAMQAIAAELNKMQSIRHNMTFRTASLEYVGAKRNVLSPATIRSYMGILNNLSSHFTSKRISDITTLDVQKEINAYSKTRSPKTVRNANGFITAVMKMFCPYTIISTTMPQKIKEPIYIPSDEDVKAVLTAAQGTRFEIPLLLAVYGMRRSEICALTLNDIDGNAITINKAKVQDEHGEWVIKTTKTTESTRTIHVPDEVINKIKAAGKIYDGDPSRISRFLAKKQDELGLPHFSLHKLRHYFVSVMSALNIPEEDIMEMGGWNTPYVMKSVYRHTLVERKKKSQEKASEKLAEIVLK